MTETTDANLFDVWYALYQVAQETEHATFGKPGYDMTLDHLHDVAVAAMETVDVLRGRLAGAVS